VLHNSCIIHRRVNLGRTLYTLGVATRNFLLFLLSSQITIDLATDCLGGNQSGHQTPFRPSTTHNLLFDTLLKFSGETTNALADGSLCRQVLRYTRPHRQAMHPSCIDIGVRSSHSARSAKPRYTDRNSFCLWGALGISSILCGEDGWKNKISCEVSTLAALAPDYDLGMPEKDGICYGSDTKDVRQV
jgi:hypothetical protein